MYTTEIGITVGEKLGSGNAGQRYKNQQPQRNISSRRERRRKQQQYEAGQEKEGEGGAEEGG